MAVGEDLGTCLQRVDVVQAMAPADRLCSGSAAVRAAVPLAVCPAFSGADRGWRLGPRPNAQGFMRAGLNG